MNAFHVTATQTNIPAAGAPDVVMFMPAGRHEISASRNGKPAKLTVHVTEAVARRIQESFAALQAAGGPAPFIGFDHAPGPAAFWPTEFFWQSSGIFVRARWTPRGKSAVTAENGGSASYRYFSPCFLADEDGNITGLPPSGEVGSLVNNPAFRSIEPIAAAHNDGTGLELEAWTPISAQERSEHVHRIQAASYRLGHPMPWCAAWAATDISQDGDPYAARGARISARTWEIQAEHLEKHGYALGWSAAWSLAQSELPELPQDPVYVAAVRIHNESFRGSSPISFDAALTAAQNGQ